MSNNVFAPRGQNVTVETITVKGSALQIIIMTGLQIAFAILAIVLGAWWMQAIGKPVGLIVLATAFFMLVDGFHWRGPSAGFTYNREQFASRPEFWTLVVIGGLALVLLAMASVWPIDPLYLERIDAQEPGVSGIYIYTPWVAGKVEGLYWLAVPPLLVTLPGIWQVVRACSIVAFPAVLYALYTGWWAANMETVMPKVRETGMRQASPDSVVVPGVGRLRPVQSGKRDEPDQEDEAIDPSPFAPGMSPPDDLGDWS